MCVPAHERDIFSRDFDKPRAGFHEPASQKASQAKAARIVFPVDLRWFQTQIKCLRGWGVQKAMRSFDRFEELILFGIQPGCQSFGFESLDVQIVSLFESTRRHAGRRLNRMYGLGRLGHEEWAMRGSEKARGLKCFDLKIFAAGGALADVDERRDIGVAWTER